MKKDDKGKNKEIVRETLLEHYHEAKLVRKIVTLISIILLAIVILIGGGGYFYIKSALQPIDKDSKSTQKVDIPIGSSVTGIGQKLETKGIIKNAKVFKYYVKLKNESGFMAGEYELSPSMGVKEIVSRLKTGKVLKEASFKITVPEGKQLTEIAHIIAIGINKSDEEVINTLNDKEFIKTAMSNYPNLLTNDILNPNVKYPLEGYLFPATYSFYKPNPSIDEIVAVMLKKTETVLNKYSDKIAAQAAYKASIIDNGLTR